MANEPTEPRALSAALSAPSPFTSRLGATALHAANRHVERWAPEATEGSGSSFRTMRSLGFVDRLVAPWIETAQRSASLRLFTHYTAVGTSEREGAAVSWVFPRPWYQDELDWMAAARRVQTEHAQADAPQPTMFTTRGTFVAPAQAPAPRAPAALPAALYEYVAPSLSIAATGSAPQPAGVGYGGGRDAYSPLVPLAAVQAAELMSRAVAPLAMTRTGDAQAPTMGRVSPQLRTVLTAMLERASLAATDTRVAQYAPELVTPPAPRPDHPLVGDAPALVPTASMAGATQLAEQYAEQRARIAELQRVARVSAEREIAVRREAQAAEQQIAARTAAAQAAQIEAQRTEATQAQTAQVSQTEAQRTQATAAEAERLRVEERIAQRMAERAQEAETQARAQAETAARAEQPRTGAPTRLHEQARVEAAQHARSLEMPARPVETVAPAPQAAAIAPPPEVVAAIAALPPELQQMIAARPEGGLAAITQVAETLRTAELLARSAAANQTFQATRGPRLVMPAGIGGLVTAVERAQVIERPMIAPPTAPSLMVGVAPAPAPALALPLIAPRTEPARVPALPWLVGPSAPASRAFAQAPASGIAPTTALGATASAMPAALSHVAWSDRWLARFAGATPRSLDILQAGSGATPEQRLEALAAAAPESIFVRPIFDVETAPQSLLRVPAFEPTSIAAPAAARPAPSLAPTPVLRPAPAPVERFDDSAETPDDVFAQIAAAAAGRRSQAIAPAATTATAAPAAPAAPAVARLSPADAIAHAAPAAPGAGLSATLAASPFAPSLRHVLPMPSTPTFDVRALFGAGLSTTYLAGLLAPGVAEIVVSGLAAPAWATFQTAGTQAGERAERMAPELDLSYVAPAFETERAAASPRAADEDVVTGPATERAAAVAAPLAAAAAPLAAAAAPLAATAAPLTTVRAALLSWTIDPAAPALAESPAVTSLAPAAAMAMPSVAARTMSQAMSLPMLGESLPAIEAGSSWTAPGMIAERAHGWSVAQERSASDLSFDFVPPELVLAARVYGLGAAEAAQAARLAVAGPGQLAAMASTVDRTFVQAMAIATERRESVRPGAQAITTAYPLSAPVATTPGAPAMPGQPSVAATPAAATPSAVAPPSREAGAELLPALPSSAFGVERRAPRGAFLWPAATVAALGLTAQVPEGIQAMSVAALELLAAQAVAEIGTYAAFSERPLPGALDTITADQAPSPQVAAAIAARAVGAAGALPSTTTADGAPALPPVAEPAEADVLGAAAALVPTARRARFDALYIALSQSPSGRSWSPAARAARALALAGRTDDAPVSAYERAASAWDVLPVVYATEGMTIAEIDAAASAGALPSLARAASRAHGLAPRSAELPALGGRVDRPGLGPLTSRAGEALGSYVAPSTGELASAASRGEPLVREVIREVPVYQRAPSAAPELVRTGAPFARHGGGEVEIPSWFEAAAKKMFEDRSGAGAGEGGFSMAELTLVTAAPSAHIAASSRTPHAAASPAPAAAAGDAKGGAGAGAVDIEKLADELYRQIMTMMDVARARNGEPYL